MSGIELKYINILKLHSLLIKLHIKNIWLQACLTKGLMIGTSVVPGRCKLRAGWGPMNQIQHEPMVWTMRRVWCTLLLGLHHVWLLSHTVVSTLWLAQAEYRRFTQRTYRLHCKSCYWLHHGSCSWTPPTCMDISLLLRIQLIHLTLLSEGSGCNPYTQDLAGLIQQKCRQIFWNSSIPNYIYISKPVIN